MRDLVTLLVKQHAGIAIIPNPTTSAARGNFMASTIVCGHLVASLRKREMFRGMEHTSVIKEGWSLIQISRVAVHDGKLKRLHRNIPQEKR
eukprot:scaffold28948_cov31-Attheya_sp.AAC.2